MSTQNQCRMDLRQLALSHGRTTLTLGVSNRWAIALMHGRIEPGVVAIIKIAASLGVEPGVVYAACQESRKRAGFVGASTLPLIVGKQVTRSPVAKRNVRRASRRAVRA